MPRDQKTHLAAEDLRGSARFLYPALEIARDADDGHDDLRSRPAQARERSSHAELEIVGMRADRQHRLARVFGKSVSGGLPPVRREQLRVSIAVSVTVAIDADAVFYHQGLLLHIRPPLRASVPSAGRGCSGA